MKKRITLLLVGVVTFFAFGNYVLADCTDEDKANAEKVKLSLKTKTKKWEGKKIYMFEIKANGLTSNMKASLNACGEYVRSFTKLKSTQSIPAQDSFCDAILTIKDKDTGCTLSTSGFYIPQFNEYSKKPICEKYSDYKYCQETYKPYLDSELIAEKIKALEKKDPAATKENKFVVLFENINLTAILIIVASILFTALVIIIIVNIVIYRKKTRAK